MKRHPNRISRRRRSLPMKRLRITVAAIAALSVLVACSGRGGGQSGGVQGITDDTITIGSSMPYSGPASSFGLTGRGAKAYIDYINKKGGVKMGDGKTRTVNLITYDDGYKPERQLANVRRLVEQDNVFALFDIFGTAAHLATVNYINDRQVPDLMLASSGNQWSQDVTTYPWTTPLYPTVSTELSIFLQNLQHTNPHAKVAILYQNDDSTKPGVADFERLVSKTDVSVVAKESYEVTDPSVDAQVSKLAASGADTLVHVSSPKAVTQALRKVSQIGWHPTQFVISVSNSVESVMQPAGAEASKDVLSIDWIKNPAIKGLESDSEAPKGDRSVATGVATAQALVAMLERLKEPSRKALVELARNIDKPLDVPMLLPGVEFTTSKNKLLPITTMQIMKFGGAAWELVGQPVSAKEN